ncbi:YozQ family protein [Neobacillus sedimentimangrovi]|jgi:Protein of unknown function (DUF4025)|uniref:YozQ family protein n=1 Tax=Neobacillus sedimentimangrovi TaxID=2699460 RepID=UPI001E4B80FC|nr:YozQ family protein [Neobacillus sedimentimangrovi]
MLEKKDRKKATEVAGSFFHPSYYHNSNPLASGIATTHEQVSDVYAEGEIGAVVEQENGKEVQIPREDNKTE